MHVENYIHKHLLVSLAKLEMHLHGIVVSYVQKSVDGHAFKPYICANSAFALHALHAQVLLSLAVSLNNLFIIQPLKVASRMKRLQAGWLLTAWLLLDSSTTGSEMVSWLSPRGLPA
jgi:hypothetical protein